MRSYIRFFGLGRCRWLAVMLIVLSVVFGGLFDSVPVFADSSISMTIDTNSLVLGMLPTSSAGNFAGSDNLNINVTLSGDGGYTLGIRANTTGTNATRLINTTDNTKYLASIPDAISASNYANNSYATANNLNNTWAYLPSKYNSVANASYQPAPDEDGDLLDVTSGTNDTGTYTISIGSK